VRAPLAGLLLASAPLLAGPTGSLLLGPAAGLLGVALAGSVGGLLAGIGAEATLAARVVGLGELSAAVLAVAPDDPHWFLPHDDWSVTRDGRWYRVGEVLGRRPRTSARAVGGLAWTPAMVSPSQGIG
jgi:hypothetical protein